MTGKKERDERGEEERGGSNGMMRAREMDGERRERKNVSGRMMTRRGREKKKEKKKKKTNEGMGKARMKRRGV